MSDVMEAIRWYQRQAGMIERRPARDGKDTERLDWLGEYGRYRYYDPTRTELGYHEIIDKCNQRTTEASFRDALDAAMDKWKEVNK